MSQCQRKLFRTSNFSETEQNQKYHCCAVEKLCILVENKGKMRLLSGIGHKMIPGAVKVVAPFYKTQQIFFIIASKSKIRSGKKSAWINQVHMHLGPKIFGVYQTFYWRSGVNSSIKSVLGV